MKSSPNKKIEAFLFLTGFVSILGQIVLLRELNIAFRGIELIYTLAFSAWLTGTALGVSAGKRNYVPTDNRIIILFLLIAILSGFKEVLWAIIYSFFGWFLARLVLYIKKMVSKNVAANAITCNKNVCDVKATTPLSVFFFMSAISMSSIVFPGTGGK